MLIERHKGVGVVLSGMEDKADIKADRITAAYLLQGCLFNV
jgi:hypothetical protein